MGQCIWPIDGSRSRLIDLMWFLETVMCEWEQMFECGRKYIHMGCHRKRAVPHHSQWTSFFCVCVTVLVLIVTIFFRILQLVYWLCWGTALFRWHPMCMNFLPHSNIFSHSMYAIILSNELRNHFPPSDVSVPGNSSRIFNVLPWISSLHCALNTYHLYWMHGS